jgi:hypothetical protein
MIMGTTNDITTFAGFGSWISTFTPEPNRSVHELDPEPKKNFPDSPTTVVNGELIDIAELPSNEEVKRDSQKTLPHPDLKPVVKPLFKPMQEPQIKIEVHNLQRLGQKKSSTDIIHVSAYSFLQDIATQLKSRGMFSLDLFLVCP